MNVDPGVLAWILIGVSAAGVAFSKIASRELRDRLFWWGVAIVVGAGTFGVLHNLVAYGTLTTPAGF